ncbi:MAG: chemotaxis protein CheD [Paraglaciecola sp.]
MFGAGNVVKGFTSFNVGERNAKFVLEYLSVENIPILARDLIDIYPRKVYFSVNSGVVNVRKLKCLHNSTVYVNKKIYKKSMKK